MMAVLLACAVAGAVVSALMPVVAIPVLRRIQVVDVANERSSHRGVALRGLGVAPWFGVAIALALALLLYPTGSASALPVLTAALAAGLLGFVEDTFGLSISVRAGMQLLIGVLLSVSVGIFESGLLAVLLVGLFFAGYVNVANFMDGINGISGAHGVVVGLSVAAVGVHQELGWLVMVGVLVAGVFGVFIPWNMGSELRFLGDVGSYLLGGVVAATVIVAVSEGVPLWALVSPLLLYIADAAYTLARRMVSRKSWREAHREHVYQRLAAAPSWGHGKVAILYGAITAFLAVIGWSVLVAPAAITAAAAVQVVVIVAFFVAAEHRLTSVGTMTREAGV